MGIVAVAVEIVDFGCCPERFGEMLLVVSAMLED